tara:strand:- start:1145 stop:1564 length:420 start_codon:yes stop_codon:yes gene_type:complete
MFNFLKKNDLETNKFSIISLTSLLIHAAKIDENYSEKEKKIIKKTLLKLGVNDSDIDDIIIKAEVAEKNSNQILEFTKEAKNLEQKDKLVLVEALWSIIYSDENADMYESNLMRRLSGLIYLDKKIVGDIKEKIKNNHT